MCVKAVDGGCGDCRDDVGVGDGNNDDSSDDDGCGGGGYGDVGDVVVFLR